MPVTVTVTSSELVLRRRLRTDRCISSVVGCCRRVERFQISPFLRSVCRLEGALGVGAAWSCMCEAIRPRSLFLSKRCGSTVRNCFEPLPKIELPPADDRDRQGYDYSRLSAKKSAGDLERLGLDAGTQSWAERIRSFYGEVEDMSTRTRIWLRVASSSWVHAPRKTRFLHRDIERQEDYRPPCSRHA